MFEPQNGLECSLVKAAGDIAHRAQFYRDFIQSDIFIIQERLPEKPVESVPAAGFQLNIRPIEQGGRLWLPVFSSLLRIQMVIKEEVSYLSMNALEFLRAIGKADVILNPGCEYGKEFTHKEIGSILDGSLWKEGSVVEERSKVLIGQPAAYPTELVSTLSRLFVQRKQVQKAYLANFFDPKRDRKPRTLVALEISGDCSDIVAEAGAAARDVEVADPPVDCVQLTENSGIAQYFGTGVKPFYERKVIGG